MKISIIGCGWLGLELGKQLATKGHQVKGSTTTPAKLEVLREGGIEPYLFRLSSEGLTLDESGLLESDLLILNTPPGRRNPKVETAYPAQISALIQALGRSPIKKILFVSSTSVFGSAAGIITEKHPLSPNTASGRALMQVESMLEDSGLALTIVRFGGLWGGDRHPGRFLAGKKDLPNGNAPVNLIHRDDCIGIIEVIIDRQIWGEVFHAVADPYPSKAKFYTETAQQLGLEPPTFKPDSNPMLAYKYIDNHKVTSVLGYSFKHR